MKINLTRTLTYYINLEKEKANNGTTKNILKGLGFTDFRRAPGFPTGDPTSGCSLAHLNVLQSLQDYEKPFIVLEDDVEINKFIKTIPNILTASSNLKVPKAFTSEVYSGLSKLIAT